MAKLPTKMLSRRISMSTNDQMPQFPEPFWREVELPSFPALNEDQSFDVTVVGGGITGITTGYLLSKEGLRVAIVEAGKILNGTTGHTTAKVTAQHSLIYDELISHFGQEKARLYYSSATDAMEFIKSTIKDKQIECDFSMEDAYIYAIKDQYASKIEKEADAYRKLGIDGSIVPSIPFEIKIQNALVMKNQGQFHPLKYLKKVVDEFTNANGVIFENTTATDIEEGAQPKLVTRSGNKITSKYIVIASHFPFYDKKGLYFTRMYPERAYVIAIKPRLTFPGGMYLSADDTTRSLRYTPVNGEKLVLVSGENHKPGQGIDTMQHYLALEEFAEEIFGIEQYKYRWSTQDLTTLDKVPYIGPITENHSNILLATGFRKWGMTNSTSAALLLKDLILEKENPYKELFSPQRYNADPSLKKFISTNADVAGHLLKGKLEFVPKDPNDLTNDEGSVVMVNGKRAGAFKDSDGKLHIVDTTCTHLGCEVEWNHGDHTWDCPCHGSRYSIDGEVIEGPTKKPLKKIEYS